MIWTKLKSSLATLAALFALATGAQAHEVRPAVADFAITGDQLTLDIRLSLEAVLAEIDQSAFTDTNDAPQAAEYDRLRELQAEDLSVILQEAWPNIAQKFTLTAGDAALVPVLVDAQIPPVGDLELGRDSQIQISASLPDDNSAIQIGWAKPMGALVLRETRQAGDDRPMEKLFTEYLQPGQVSPEILRDARERDTEFQTFVKFITIGFEHILPKGLDHILFVLGLFLFSTRMRPLLWQISAFTVAHTITLGLASYGVVNAAPELIEPLIAASIVYVAVENILFTKMGWWRPVVIFGLGLLHGLGFAFMLGEFITTDRFLTGLIGFNIGVELGQITVILLAFALVGYWFGNKPWYRKVIVIPASAVIALIAMYWVVERTILA
jgi:hypothetical protein